MESHRPCSGLGAASIALWIPLAMVAGPVSPVALHPALLLLTFVAAGAVRGLHRVPWRTDGRQPERNGPARRARDDANSRVIALKLGGALRSGLGDDVAAAC
ncbi:MAG: hypothetical protein R2705_10130 [Ilumatobacteraceae bacterium]